ncbi:MAG: carbohydrate binding domain-containing protein, partial [Pirellulales bacterium]
SLLAFSALALQRVQNRMLSASVDVRQAQLNAEAAIELGLLAIKNDPNWRTTYTNGTWFSSRSTGEGGCTLTVTDPIDANLADSATEAIVMTGIGSAGKAVQRVVRTIDSYSKALGCLRSSVAAGGALNLSSSVLRATNSGLISANSSSASGSTVYGKVEAVTVSGSTYSGTTAQIAAADRPAMPNWATVFDYYRTNGTEISLGTLSSVLSIVRNATFETGTTYWTGAAIGVPAATISQSINRANTGTYSLRVTARSAWNAGASQYIDGYVKPNQQYYIGACIWSDTLFPRNYRIRVATKGTLSSESNQNSADLFVLGRVWTPIFATLPADSWSGDLEYAFVKIAGADSSNTVDFYMDDVAIQETTTGQFIYRRALGPGVNTLGGATNAQGLYWINCSGTKLVIERSRIKGTLLVVNPGAGSCIGPGPIHWSPATPGYPALLVDADTASNADFTIAATNRSLNEAEDVVNYNPTGMSHDTLGQDSDMNDIYPSEIQGLVVVEDDVTFQNNALVRGVVIAGDAVTSTSGALEVVYRPDALFSPPPGFTDTPSQVGRPLSIRKAVLP